MPVFKSKPQTKTLIKLFLTFALLNQACLASAQDKPNLSVGGRMMLDFDSFDDSLTTDGNTEERRSESEVRRLRANIKADLSNNWQMKISVEGSDGKAVIEDAYLSYQGWEMLKLNIGRQVEPFGLDRMMSSKHLAFPERAIISNAIAPARNYGMLASGKHNKLSWQLGYFQDFNSQKSQALTGRFVWQFLNNQNSTLHVGTAFSSRDLKSAEFKISERLEVHTADSLLKGIPIDANSAFFQGLEFLWQHKGIVTTAEWQKASIETDDGDEFDYEGAYLQVSYFLSGQHRKYQGSVLKAPKQASDWELSLRYSELSLERENTRADVVSAGVNYYIDEHWKITASYLLTEYSRAINEDNSGNAVSLRLQYTF